MISVQDRETIIKVKLIGSLKVGQKINTKYLLVQEDSLLTMISRRLYGESRTNSVLFCRNAIEQIMNMDKRINDPNIKKTICNDLVQAKLGLIALQETYVGDVRVVSELEEILSQILPVQPP